MHHDYAYLNYVHYRMAREGYGHDRKVLSASRSSCLSISPRPMQAALDRLDSESDGQADPSRWMPLHNVQDTVAGPLTDIVEDPETVVQQQQQQQQNLPSSPPPTLPCIPETSEPPSAKLLSEGEEGRRGQGFYKHFVEATGGKLAQVRCFHQAAMYVEVCTCRSTFSLCCPHCCACCTGGSDPGQGASAGYQPQPQHAAHSNARADGVTLSAQPQGNRQPGASQSAEGGQGCCCRRAHTQILRAPEGVLQHRQQRGP